MPINIAIEKFLTASPPNINKDIMTSNVVKDVTSVLDRVWLIDLSSTSRIDNFRKIILFSLILSNTTIESFSEYPITAKIAAKTLRSNVNSNNEKTPSVIITSCISAVIAPKPYISSNLINKKWKIEIEDNGPGTNLSQEQLVRPFIKGSDQLNQGTGLGLSIVQKLIKLNNGELNFQKSSHGGLKVTIILQI